MALSARELALRLARHIGVSTFDPADPTNEPPAGLQPGDVGYLTACINGALGELWNGMPSAFRHARAVSALMAPQPVSLTLTQGSTAISDFTGYAAWMEGCTIRMGEWENEILSDQQLLYPHGGPTAPGGSTLTAMVYGDCVTPQASVTSVSDPICAASRDDPGEHPLQRLLHRQAFEAARGALGRAAGVPTVCFVETRYLPGQTRLGIRLRVYPMPARAGTLAYGTRLEPPAIDAADLGSDTDPEVFFPLPAGWDEAVLLPLALLRFSAHPLFKPTNQRAELVRQADAARAVMLGSTPERNAVAMVPVFR